MSAGIINPHPTVRCFPSECDGQNKAGRSKLRRPSHVDDVNARCGSETDVADSHALAASCLAHPGGRRKFLDFNHPEFRLSATSIQLIEVLLKPLISSLSIMAAARLSPTGNLLRKSRLFSLPPTLSPPVEPASSKTVAESDTATLPYPIRQAIQTHPSSLARGDWGLKRPLPSKSTTDKSLSPVVRINHLDTFEHVTDFESAGDHAVTLKKFQELSLPISKTTDTGVPAGIGGGRHESVFESASDNMVKTESSNAKRYRYRGPWLAGQTQSEFERFLKKIGSTEKAQFLNMVRKHLANKRHAEKEREARAEGEELSDESPVPLTRFEFNQAMKELRADPSALGPLVNRFFDLATPPIVPTSYITKSNWTPGPSDLSTVRYAHEGPPKTHPSAGLSYIRTLSHLDNHPVAGPQQHQRPVPTRFLRAKSRVQSSAIRALVGVGGIVVEDGHVFAFSNRNSQGTGNHVDPDVPGGTKFWSRPDRVMITSEGTISMKIGRPLTTTKSLYGMEDEKKPLPDSVRGADRVVPRLA